MAEIITVEYWEGVTSSPLSIHLSDQSNADFILKMHGVFAPFRPKGIIRPLLPDIQSHIAKLISNEDAIYLEPALVAEYLGSKQWEDLSVADGAFLLNNGSWLKDEEWLGTLPYSMEFLLRAEDLPEVPVGSFIFHLTEDVQRFKGRLPGQVRVSICEFLTRFKQKRENELSAYPDDPIARYDLEMMLEDIDAAEKAWTVYCAT